MDFGAHEFWLYSYAISSSSASEGRLREQQLVNSSGGVDGDYL